MENDTTLAVLKNDISYIKNDISEIKESLKDLSTKYVSKDEFTPVRNIAYTLVGVLGIATLTAIFKLIIK